MVGMRISVSELKTEEMLIEKPQTINGDVRHVVSKINPNLTSTPELSTSVKNLVLKIRLEVITIQTNLEQVPYFIVDSVTLVIKGCTDIFRTNSA